MRTAIATDKYFKSNQTFVNRHIRFLFGGNTCVISQSVTDESRPSAPFLIWEDVPQTTWEKAISRPIRFYNSRRYGVRDIPWGSQKKAIKEFLQEQNVQAILSEFGTQTYRLARIADELGVPLIGYFRGSDATSELRKKRRIRAYQSIIPHTRGFIAVSQYLFDNLAKHGVKHPRSYVIPSGVDVRTFMPAEKVRGRCVAVGRMVEKKAPLLTLRAFNETANIYPWVSLEMIGDGPMLDACRDYVTSQGLTGRVVLRGAQPHEEVKKALERAEIFLQHSVIGQDGNAEGLPTAIQEAMSCGLAIVSTRHAGIPEAVREGDNGLLVEEFDIKGYASALKSLIENQSELTRMMKRSRSLAENEFDNQRLLKRTEDIIAMLAASHHCCM
jgi:glycosyltransferase involved in cell wall biosynthesis